MQLPEEPVVLDELLWAGRREVAGQASTIGKAVPEYLIPIRANNKRGCPARWIEQTAEYFAHRPQVGPFSEMDHREIERMAPQAIRKCVGSPAHAQKGHCSLDHSFRSSPFLAEDHSRSRSITTSAAVPPTFATVIR